MINLISRDPITLARYLDNRFKGLLKYMYSKGGPFVDNPIVDYFWRTDFHYRGSGHSHQMTWNQHAPLYDKTIQNKEDYEYNTQRCCDFIDKYITCSLPEGTNMLIESASEDDFTDNEDDDEEVKKSQTSQIKKRPKEVNLNIQRHKHKINCFRIDEYGNKICQYNFPKPILNKTIMLEPINCEVTGEMSPREKEILYEEYIRIREELEIVDKMYKADGTFTTLEDLLTDLNISYETYKLCLRSSIKRSTVFLKRTCREIMINQYNKDIILRHRGNMDIQFITDPYGAAAYVTAYMLKSNAVMSKLLKKAVVEIRLGNDVFIYIFFTVL